MNGKGAGPALVAAKVAAEVAADRAAAPSPASTSTPTPLYVAPPVGFAPMRVVLLLPPAAPAWLLHFIELAATSRWIELVMQPVADARAPEVATVAMDVKLHLALERFRRRQWQQAGTLARVQVGERSAIVPRPELAPGLPVEGLCAAVRALDPDLVLLLGQAAWCEALADCAQSGCWLLDAGLVDALNGGIDLLGPMVAAAGNATGVGLELAYADGRVDRLDDSWGSTQRHSFIAQREQAMRKLPALLLRSLRRLAAGGIVVPARRAAVLRLAPQPKVFAAGLRAFARAGRRSVGRRLGRLRGVREGEPWQLVLRRDATRLDPAAPVVEACTLLQPGGDLAWADPCVVADGRRALLFAEEFPESMGKGRIVCLQLRDDGGADHLGIALEEPFHLSYPLPFRWQDQWYMTVESNAARRVSLYRAVDFPLRWERACDLVEGRACVDPTLHFHEGRWYLFANVSESGGSTCDELFLFVGDSPMGPFQPHPANPIVTDVRWARPAGRLFEHRGRLVRPAQDCEPSYGAAVAFREVTVLTPNRYEERPLGRLAAWGPGMDGCHTYSVADGIEVLDVRDRSRRRA